MKLANKISYIFIVCLITIIAFHLLKYEYIKYMVRNYGIPSKAYISDIFSGGSEHGSSANYRFIYKHQEYTGNYAINDDDDNLGDSITVLFIQSNPKINYPAFYALRKKDKNRIKYLHEFRKLDSETSSE